MIGEKQQTLLGPIQKKAIENIRSVAKESGYAYVFEAGTLLVSPPSDDILPLVKKKMGIVDKAPSANPNSPKINNPPAAGGAAKPKQ
jgi:outer membrane protein